MLSYVCRNYFQFISFIVLFNLNLSVQFRTQLVHCDTNKRCSHVFTTHLAHQVITYIAGTGSYMMRLHPSSTGTSNCTCTSLHHGTSAWKVLTTVCITFVLGQPSRYTVYVLLFLFILVFPVNPRLLFGKIKT